MKVEVERRETQSLDLRLNKPELPIEWDYLKSGRKVKATLYRWCRVTAEIACELWIARAKLSQHGGNRKSAEYQRRKCTDDASWSQYCQDFVGRDKSTVNRWLKQWFDPDSLVGKFTGNAENYTPKAIVDKVRKVLGVIDLDPASCETAQTLIQAKRYYTRETNGLDKSWSGNVFLNPPYGMPDIRDFTDKLITELPNIKAAILLTNDQADTTWWQKCARQAETICFYSGRIKFYTPTKDETAPTNGQTFMYFGPQAVRFENVFHDIGLLMRVIQ